VSSNNNQSSPDQGFLPIVFGASTTSAGASNSGSSSNSTVVVVAVVVALALVIAGIGRAVRRRRATVHPG
jgi:hypothetical protein